MNTFYIAAIMYLSLPIFISIFVAGGGEGGGGKH